jgi:hypothetical protein
LNGERGRYCSLLPAHTRCRLMDGLCIPRSLLVLARAVVLVFVSAEKTEQVRSVLPTELDRTMPLVVLSAEEVRNACVRL